MCWLLAAIIFIKITMGMGMETKRVGMGMLVHPRVTLSSACTCCLLHVLRSR